MHLIILFLALISVHPVYSQCGGVLTADGEGNSLSIKSIIPDTSVPLTVGQIVDLEIEVDYQVVKSNAVIFLQIQKGEMTGNDAGFLIASKTVVLDSAAGTVKIKQSFKVPRTGAIVVQVPLMMAGAGMTSVADMRAYKVLDEAGKGVDIDAAMSSPKQTAINDFTGEGSINLSSFSPDNSKPLYVGDTVKLEFYVETFKRVELPRICLTFWLRIKERLLTIKKGAFQ